MKWPFMPLQENLVSPTPKLPYDTRVRRIDGNRANHNQTYYTMWPNYTTERYTRPIHDPQKYATCQGKLSEWGQSVQWAGTWPRWRIYEWASLWSSIPANSAPLWKRKKTLLTSSSPDLSVELTGALIISTDIWQSPRSFLSAGLENIILVQLFTSQSGFWQVPLVQVD